VAKVEMVIYSKPDCNLCDEIKAQLKKLQRRHRFEMSEVNILEDPEALNRFREEIPVVFINGRKAFKFRLDEQEFLRKLQRGPHI